MILSLCSYAGHLHHYPLLLPFGRGRGEREGAVVRCAVRSGGAEHGQGTTPLGIHPLTDMRARGPRSQERAISPFLCHLGEEGGRGKGRLSGVRCGRVGRSTVRAQHRQAAPAHRYAGQRPALPGKSHFSLPLPFGRGRGRGKGRLSGVRCGRVGRSTVRAQHRQAAPAHRYAGQRPALPGTRFELLRRSYPFDSCPKCCQPFINPFVTTVNLTDIVNHAPPFRTERCRHHSHTGANVWAG